MGGRGKVYKWPKTKTVKKKKVLVVMVVVAEWARTLVDGMDNCAGYVGSNPCY